MLDYHFPDDLEREYPISIGIDEYYLQKVLIEWEKQLEVTSFATEGDERWKTDRFTAQQVRIVVKDIRDKTYYFRIGSIIKTPG